MVAVFLVSFCLAVAHLVQAANTTNIDWTSLTYQNQQDRLVDFSQAGTYATSQSLPSAYEPASIVLQATDASQDRTMEIQAALDQLSSIGGGILELGAGQWNLSSSSIFITGVGVTLRGELPEQAGDSSKTVIRVSGESRIPFVIGSANPESIVYRNGTATEIVTQYVGAGQTTFEVEDASHLQSGDYVEIQRTVTEEWIKAEGMDNLVRDGKQQTWIEPGTIYSQRRQIAAINNQTIQLNYGLTDPLNQTTDGLSTILRYDLPFNFTRSCSLESMTIQLVDDQSGNPINDDDNFSQALIFQPWGSDNWARQLSISGFISAVHVARDATRVTLQDVNFWRSQPTDKSAGYPADILIEGSQVLLHRCSTAGVNNSDSFAVATGSLVAGPISVVNHATSDVRHMIEPHARWATGVLIDNSLIGTLNLINRGVYGSGQGWACAFSVAWNVISFGTMSVQNPPQSANLCVGCLGQIDESEADPDSYISPQALVSPDSLFLAQLAGRFGTSVANSILLPAANEADRPSASGSASASASSTTGPIVVGSAASDSIIAGPTSTTSTSSTTRSSTSTSSSRSSTSSSTRSSSTTSSSSSASTSSSTRSSSRRSSQSTTSTTDRSSRANLAVQRTATEENEDVTSLTSETTPTSFSRSGASNSATDSGSLEAVAEHSLPGALSSAKLEKDSSIDSVSDEVYTELQSRQDDTSAASTSSPLSSSVYIGLCTMMALVLARY